jgi:glycosyltransferase involved in cell wall biosynthesis
MESPILVSIIVPIYNIEAYLPRCLTSIIEQTYAHLEIILTNDGSTDSCLEICESFAKKDDRIIIINQENQGISAARNVALDIAKGSYITFIDGDDFVHKDFISFLLNSLLKTNSQISVGNYKAFHVNETINESLVDLPMEEILMSPQEFAMNLYQNEIPYTFITACSKLYTANLFDGLRFPVGKLYEDESVNYLLAFRANKIVFLPTQIYFYFIRDGSETHKDYSLRNFEKLEAFANRILFFKQINETKLVNETSYAYLKLIISNSINLRLYFPEEDLLFKELMIKYSKTYFNLLCSNIRLSRKLYILFLFPSFIQSNLFFKLRNLFLSFHVKFNRFFE